MAPCPPNHHSPSGGHAVLLLIIASRLAAALMAAWVLVGSRPAVAQLQQLHSLCANPTVTLDERIAACSQLITSGWDNGRNLAVSYFNRGAAWGKKNQLDRAVADLNEAISIQPNYLLPYNARGIAYLQQCSLDQALSDFNHAIELNPTFVQAYNNRAATFLSKGDADHAVAEATTAIQFDTGYALAYATRAVSNIKLRQFDLASADIDRALSLNPNLPQALNARGELHASKNQTDEAIADFDLVIQIDPAFASAYANRGFALSRKGDLDRAITDYNQAIQLRPKCAGAYNGRAKVFILKGELQNALDDATTATNLRPTFAAAFTTRGSIYLKTDNPAEALRDLTLAIHLDPNIPDSYTERGLAYERLADPVRARSDFEAVLAMSPKYSTSQWAIDIARTHIAALSEVNLPAATTTKTGALPDITGALPDKSLPIDRKLSDASIPATGSGGAAAPKNTARTAANITAKPLVEVIAACDKQFQPTASFTLPGPTGDIAIDRCYRGPDHLTCVATAIATEARAISQDYKDIATPNYADVASVDAICRMDPATIADQLQRAKGFDARWLTMNDKYNEIADCSNRVEESIRQVVLPDMRRGGDVVKSMIEQIQGGTRQLSETQREVSALSHEIDASKKALAIFPGIRASMCPKGPS